MLGDTTDSFRFNNHLISAAMLWSDHSENTRLHFRNNTMSHHEGLLSDSMKLRTDLVISTAKYQCICVAVKTFVITPVVMAGASQEKMTNRLNHKVTGKCTKKRKKNIFCSIFFKESICVVFVSNV